MEVADVLRWHAQGLTQQQIADKFEPPRSQSTISDVLARFGPDRTHEAKAILRGSAADMALKIVANGQPKDLVQALKGLSVLRDEESKPVFQVFIGRPDARVVFEDDAHNQQRAEVIDVQQVARLTKDTLSDANG
jgi:hypothetical protein